MGAPRATPGGNHDAADRWSPQLSTPAGSTSVPEEGSVELLLAGTLAALFWANSPWSQPDEALRAFRAAVSVGAWELHTTSVLLREGRHKAGSARPTLQPAIEPLRCVVPDLPVVLPGGRRSWDRTTRS